MGGTVDLESRPVMKTWKPLGGARGGARRTTGGEGLTVRLWPIAQGWEAHLETDDGEMFYGEARDNEPGRAVNRAFQAYQEAKGKTRTKGHAKG